MVQKILCALPLGPSVVNILHNHESFIMAHTVTRSPWLPLIWAASLSFIIFHNNVTLAEDWLRHTLSF